MKRKKYFRGQTISLEAFEARQILKPGQQVVWVQLLGQNRSQANFEARPNEGTRPGFIVCPDHGAIKLRHAHSCFKSHFYTLYSYQKSETKFKSELVYVLWPGAWASSLPT